VPHRRAGQAPLPSRVRAPFGNGEDGLVSLGYMAETTAELIGSAADLVAQERRYASAALIRHMDLPIRMFRGRDSHALSLFKGV
jgi:hypothetical protein